MSVMIESVTITPKAVNAEQQFLLSVKVQVGTYARLKNFAHRALQKFKHNELLKKILK